MYCPEITLRLSSRCSGGESAVQSRLVCWLRLRITTATARESQKATVQYTIISRSFFIQTIYFYMYIFSFAAKWYRIHSFTYFDIFQGFFLSLIFFYFNPNITDTNPKPILNPIRNPNGNGLALNKVLTQILFLIWPEMTSDIINILFYQ